MRRLGQARHYLLFNKPFQVLCQFSCDVNQQEERRLCLKDFIDVPDVYPCGRLDFDSEGLVVLTNDGAFQHRLSDPRFGHERTYWVQVEGTPVDNQLAQLRRGVRVQDYQTGPAQVSVIDEPQWPPRQPPIRVRQQIPTSWLELTLTEGRNRQVRRMTAAVGLPTLRLIRAAIGPWQVGQLAPGAWRSLRHDEVAEDLRAAARQKHSYQPR